MKRIIQLDGLRAFAFLAVFANHAAKVPLMWVGVDVFFVLSGFLITNILLGIRAMSTPRYFGQFYARRARRILPPYCIAILLAIVLRSDVPWRSDWIWMAIFSSNIPVAFHLANMGPLVPLWSLAIEEHFYLLWPLIILWFERRTLRTILLTLVIFIPFLRAAFTPLAHTAVFGYLFIFAFTPFRIDLLAAGSLIALYWEQDHKRVIGWQKYAKYIAICTGFCFAVPALLFPVFRAKANSMIFNTLGYSLSVVTCTALVVYVLTLSGGPIYKLLTNKVIMWLGTISYMCYLVHDIFLELLGRGTLWQLVGAFALTIVFSALSWRFIEAPILGKTRLTKRWPVLPSAPQAE